MHTFSNGGCRVYQFLSNLIHNSKTFASITLCGVVFDSCPSAANICRGVRVYMSLCNYSFLVKYCVAFCLFVWFVVALILSRCAECIPFVRILAHHHWASMCSDPASCPHLFLYSVKDAVIPYRDVEKMIAIRRNRGVRVLTQRWDDSEHVTHLITHRETYTTTCLDFIQHCLRAE